MAAVQTGDPEPGVSRPRTAGRDEELARRAIGGDSAAFGLLFDRWFDRVFDVAWHIVHRRDLAADVAQDAFVAAWTGISNLRQPESFGGWLLRIARNKALNRLERERRSRPVGAEDDLVMLDPRPGEDPTEELTRSESGALVWAASAALGEDDASLLHLHLRHDLGAQELAEELGVKPNAAHQKLFRLKQRLADAIGAWVLWRGGTPDCADLRTALGGEPTRRFDRATAKLIGAHTRDCSTCLDQRDVGLRPDALFAATPLVVAEPLLRAEVAAALADLDVPVPADERPPDGERRDDEPGDDEPGDDEPGNDEPGNDEPPDDEPADQGPPDGGDTTPDENDDGTLDGTEMSGRWPRRRAVEIAAGLAAMLVVGIVAVGVLADRAGDGTAPSGGAPAADLSPTTGPGLADRTTPGDRTTSPPTTDAPTTTTTSPTTTTTAQPASTSDGTEPGAVGSSDNGAVADPTPPAGTTATPTTTTTAGTGPGDPDQTAPAPEIVRFTTRQGNMRCGGGETPVEFVWASTDATAATLGPAGGAASPVEPTGTAQRCALAGNWTLTVTGPGGTDTAPVTIR